MTKISKSSDRHSFQKEGYVKQCEEKGEEPNQDYLDFFQKILEDHNKKFDDPATHVNNMEYDLLTTDWMLEKVRQSRSYAQNLYAAMCNNDFIKKDVWPILQNQTWSCSWRYAGGIVADMRTEGDYIDWYCSGIRDSDEPDEKEWNSWSVEKQHHWKEVYSNYVGESVVTEEIRQDLARLGWLVQCVDNTE
jgi:hypothetical protein